MKKRWAKQLSCFVISMIGFGMIKWLINWTKMERINIIMDSVLGLFLLVAFFSYVQYIYSRSKTFQRKELLIVYVFAVFFLASEILGYTLQINATEGGVEFTAANCFVLILFILFFSVPVAISFLHLKDNKIGTEGNIRKTWMKGICIWIGISLLWLPFFFAFYPGITGYDITSQWPQFEGNFYEANHPVIHTLFMGTIFETGKFLWGNYNRGVALYTFLQLLVLAGSVSYGLYVMMGFRIPAFLRNVVIIYYVCMPVYPILGVSTTKDVYFSIFFLVTFVELVSYIENDDIRLKNCLMFIGFLILSQLFRNNMVYGVILFEIIVLLLWKQEKEQKRRKKIKILIGQIFLAVILYQVFYTGINTLVSASPGKVVEMLSVPCQQMARVYNENSDQLTEAEKEELFSYFNEDGLKTYRWELADSIKGCFHAEQFEESPEDFFSLWIRLGLKYPKLYIESFLYNTLPLWYTGDRTILEIKGGDYLEVDFKLDQYGITQSHSLLPAWQKICLQLCQKGEILDVPIVSLLFIPAAYVWAIGMILIFMILSRNRLACALPLFLFCYIVTLLFGPCILPRYCMNFMLCTPILCLYYLHQIIDKEKQEKILREREDIDYEN